MTTRASGSLILLPLPQWHGGICRAQRVQVPVANPRELLAVAVLLDAAADMECRWHAAVSACSCRPVQAGPLMPSELAPSLAELRNCR